MQMLSPLDSSFPEKLLKKININKKSNQNKNLQLKIDVTDDKSVDKISKQIFKAYGKVDSVIFSVTSKPKDFYRKFTDCSIKGWKSVIDTELNGAFNISRSFGKIMEKQNYGNIIFISSIYGIVGNDQKIYKGSNLTNVYLKKDNKNSKSENKQIFSHAAYPVAKGGLISFSKFLAAYWGKYNIRVNCISPGGIENERENKVFRRKYSEKVPLGRKTRADEISGAVVYLISDESSYVTGHNLIVDGGYTIW